MAILYIREYFGLGQDLMGQVIQTGLEPVTLSGAGTADRTLVISGVTLTSLSQGVNFVRLNADAVCSIKFHTTSSVSLATKTNARMSANSTEFFAIDGNTMFISCIVNT